MELSAVIITLNEERNLDRCLRSLVGVADEVVVVDSGSTDRTREITDAHGARFIHHTFEGHIEQKNWAITQASHPWVLSLDADEALSPELAESIRRVKAAPEADGYSMNRLTNYCGSWIRHGGWYPDRKLRLWDSSKGAWTGINPHDRYELRPGHRESHLHGDLLHYSYYTLDDHVRQVNFFTTIAAKDLHRRGKRGGFIKLFLSPAAKFIGDYVFRGGFLDGWHGLVIARISAHATFLKYAKLRELRRAKT